MFEVLMEPLVRLMLDLSRENPENPESLKKALEQVDMFQFLTLCREHELEGVVASHILAWNLCPLTKEWKAAYEKEKERLSFLHNKAKETCELMFRNGITMCVLKNGGIMSDMIRDVAACPMEDIDSLVRKSDFIKAHELLIANGFVFKFRNAYEAEKLEHAYRGGSTEYYISIPDGGKVWFELAWRAVAGRWIRQDLEPDSDDLIGNSYFAANSHIAILSPEDNLLQVCIHTAKHSYVRAPGLRLHLDVERILAHKTIDWRKFVIKVETVHVKTAVYFSLFLAKLLFSSPVPDEILTCLRPTPSKEKRILSSLDQVGLLYPKKAKFTKWQFLQFQTSLYDSVEDMLSVLYPKNGLLHEIYGYRSPLKTPFYILVHALDLIGIRNKKS